MLLKKNVQKEKYVSPFQSATFSALDDAGHRPLQIWAVFSRSIS